MSATGFSQIDSRVRFFRIEASTTAYTVSSPQAIMTSVGSTTATLASGILRDAGKSITVVDSQGSHVAVYRLVHTVTGAAVETPYYVKVWDAAGSGVTVARLG